MAATTTHNVSAQEVVGDLAWNTEYVTQSDSTPLNLDLVDKWIDRASGVLNAILSSKGIDALTLAADDPDAAEVVRMGIFAYATWRALSKLKADEFDIRDARKEWKDIRDTVRTLPEELGNAAPLQVHSNIDSDSPTEKNFGSGFGGW